MDKKEFEKLLEHRIELTKKVLSSKNKEYASDSDKLHNFKRAAGMLQKTPETSLIGMWTKHIISILDIVDKIEAGEHDFLNNSMLEEKIGDAVNYLIILEAMIKERYGW